MKHGVKLCNYISPTSVGESVQLFSRLAQAALATLIYPVKIVDERSLLRLFDVPRRVVNRREDSLDREGGCVHKCAAIHRNLCCIANRILSPPPLLFYLFFSLLFLLLFFLLLLLLREQYLLAVMKTGYHASASRSLSCVKGILEITNNLNAVCLSLRTFTWAVYELWGGKKSIGVLRAWCPRSEMIFIGGKKTTQLIRSPTFAPRLCPFLPRARTVGGRRSVSCSG